MENFESKLKKLKDLYESSNKEVKCIEEFFMSKENAVDYDELWYYVYECGVRAGIKESINAIAGGDEKV